MEVKVSVVVPIYNVAPYLNECVDSIIAQTLKEIEIILVDDGSTDGSSDICDYYAESFDYIKVVHQENQGTYMARRNGVNCACGEYIGFVDGDDWIDEDMYELLYNEAVSNDADVVTSGIMREYQNSYVHPVLKDSLDDGTYVDKELTILKSVISLNDSKRLNGSLCNKLFRNSIIRLALEAATDGAKVWMEDTVSVFSAVFYSRTVRITSYCKYHHRERSGSAIYAKNKKVLEDVSRAYNALVDIIKDSEYYNELYNQIAEFITVSVIDGLNKAFDCEISTIPKYYVRLDEEIEIGARVIIYGFGEVGRSIYKQILAERKYSIVAIADIRVDTITEDSCIIHPNDIEVYDADYVIIAIKNEKTAEDICIRLKQEGISKKIIWKKPCLFLDYYKA